MGQNKPCVQLGKENPRQATGSVKTLSLLGTFEENLE